MITQTKSFKTSSGSVHATLEEAQRAELDALGRQYSDEQCGGNAAAHILADFCLMHRDRILDILCTDSRSRAARRRVNGAAAPKRKKSSRASEMAAERLSQAVVHDRLEKMREAVDAA